MDQRGKGKVNKASSKSGSNSSMKAKKPAYKFAATLEQFISQTLPLIDLEKVLLFNAVFFFCALHYLLHSKVAFEVGHFPSKVQLVTWAANAAFLRIGNTLSQIQIFIACVVFKFMFCERRIHMSVVLGKPGSRDSRVLRCIVNFGPLGCPEARVHTSQSEMHWCSGNTTPYFSS